jgi:hypothetical protein
MIPGLTCHRCNAPISGERGAPMAKMRINAGRTWGRDGKVGKHQ